MIDKLALMRRLRAEGRWPEAEAFKNDAIAEFKANGVDNAVEEAWSATEQKFLPSDELADDDEAPGDGPYCKGIDDSEEFERGLRAGKPVDCMCGNCLRVYIVRKLDRIATLEAYIGRNFVDRGEAPAPGSDAKAP
jgi:hypothetical protein